jgi:uncharacterized protein (DUF2141 family)
LIFNQKLKSPEVIVLEPSALDVSKKFRFSPTKDSLKVWLTDLSFDSTKISIKDEGKLLQTTTLTRGKKETYLRSLVVNTNLEGNVLNPHKPLKINFNLPIESADASKVVLLEDSVEIENFTLIKDSTDFLSYTLKYPWKPKKTYDLKLTAGAFIAIFNTKNKEYPSTFTVAGKDNYGTLKAKIVTTEKDKNYILQVVDGNKQVINTLLIKQDTAVNFTNYKAGKYFIRITYDSNKNGVWDTGNVSKGLQPEKIWDVPKELSIKPLWERNETITIPKE